MYRKLLYTLLFLLLGVPLLVVAVAATRPATYLVQRSIHVAAPPAAVYAEVVDFRRWERWSPWARLDPGQKTTLVGSGLGAVYTWSGNDKVGAGRMTIVEAVPGSKVGIRLEFLRPFASTNETSFLVVPDGDGSRLTWLMKGNHGYVGRAMSIFMDMDQVLGPDFEKGLASLKREVEHPAP
jgi:carbon monoxide dehydrogenase subunit G